MVDGYQDAINDASRELMRAKQLILDEIKSYPTPISGCDAQFNHLLSVRSQITASLNALSNPVFVPTPRTLTKGAGVESR